MKLKYILSLMIIIFITLLIIWSGYKTVLNTKKSQVTLTHTETKFDKFETVTLEGDKYISPQEGIIVYEVFAQWCFPCRTSVPQTLMFAKHNPEIKVIGIAFRDIDKRVKEFQNEYGAFSTTIMSNNQIERNLGITNAPQTLFVVNNIIVYRIYGISYESDLNEVLSLVKRESLRSK